MKLSINAIYNLGRAEKGAEKLFMSGQAILDAFRTGAYTKLSNGQKAKLRKIANRLNKQYMWTQDWTPVPFHRYQNKLANQVQLDVERNNRIYNIELPQKILDADVFIYAMAKVGGQTLKNTAEAYGLNALHLHDLSRGMNQNILNMTTMKDDFIFSMQHIQDIAKQRKNKMKIITAFRDPIAGYISLAFQVFYFLWFEEYHQNFSTVAEAVIYFLEHKIQKQMFIDWFKQELYPFTGVDLMAHPFDKQQGYTIIQSDWFDLLVLRTDKISDNAAVIGNFLGISHFQLINSNKASDKWYAQHYKDFIKEYKLTPTEIDRFYNNGIMKYFFNDKEILELEKKWTKKEG